MARDEEVLARRAAREARRALLRARNGGDESRDAPSEADAGQVDLDDEERPEDAGEEENQAADADPAPPARTRESRRRPREGAKLLQVEQVLRSAREQLRRLSGGDAESVSSFDRTGDGWLITLEVLELRRIPDTTDVLASYAVELDDDGNLLSYSRVRRYQRSETLDGGGP